MRPIFLLSIAACIGASSCTGSKLQPTRGDTRTVLAVEQQEQEPMLCVPTSAAMVMAFYNDPHPPREIKALSAGKVYDAKATFDDFTITRYDDVIRAVGVLGYNWTQRVFSNDDTGFKDGLALIEDQVRSGNPVLVDATLPSGHTFVIRGFDTSTHQLFAVDPDRAAPGENTISFDDFRSVWNERAYGNDFRVMIITQPKV